MSWKDDCVIELIGYNTTPGGQHAGVRNYPVKVTHEPSGTIAQCVEFRSQHKNKETAFEMIEWALLKAKII